MKLHDGCGRSARKPLIALLLMGCGVLFFIQLVPTAGSSIGRSEDLLRESFRQRDENRPSRHGGVASPVVPQEESIRVVPPVVATTSDTTGDTYSKVSTVAAGSEIAASRSPVSDGAHGAAASELDDAPASSIGIDLDSVSLEKSVHGVPPTVATTSSTEHDTGSDTYVTASAGSERAAPGGPVSDGADDAAAGEPGGVPASSVSADSDSALSTTKPDDSDGNDDDASGASAVRSEAEAGEGNTPANLETRTATSLANIMGISGSVTEEQCLRYAVREGRRLVFVGDSLLRDILTHFRATWENATSEVPKGGLSFGLKLPLAQPAADGTEAADDESPQVSTKRVPKASLELVWDYAARTVPMQRICEPNWCPISELPAVTVFTRGQWDAMNYGNPPSQLLAGVRLVVREFFARAAAQAARRRSHQAEDGGEAAPTLPLFVMYLPHCPFVHDSPKPHRVRLARDEWLNPFRRAAACAVAQELRSLAARRAKDESDGEGDAGGWNVLERVGRVAVFDVCGAVKASPPGTSPDGIHIKLELRKPLADDLLGRYMCPEYGDVGRWNGTWGTHASQRLRDVATSVEARYDCEPFAPFGGASDAELRRTHPDEYGKNDRDDPDPTPDADAAEPGAGSGEQLAGDPPADAVKGNEPVSEFCPVHAVDSGLGWWFNPDAACQSPDRTFNVADECILALAANTAVKLGSGFSSEKQFVKATPAPNMRTYYVPTWRFAPHLCYTLPLLDDKPQIRLFRPKYNRYGATAFLAHLCRVHDHLATRGTHCRRYNVTGIPVGKALRPKLPSFDNVVLWLLGHPDAWPLCALNLGARIVYGNESATEARLRWADRLGVSSRVAKYICKPDVCTPTADRDRAAMCAELTRRQNAARDARYPRRVRYGFKCDMYDIAQMDMCSEIARLMKHPENE